jgi:hypothetical protein
MIPIKLGSDDCIAGERKSNSINDSECKSLIEERQPAVEDGTREELDSFNLAIPRDYLGEFSKSEDIDVQESEKSLEEQDEKSLEEQDDYMSAAFLDSIEGKDEEVKSYKRKRIKQINESMLKGNGKSKEILRIEEWDQSQSKKLTVKNKGFQMLLKMGYKEGQSIGKTLGKNALIDPIAVSLKNDKLGLGKSSKASKSYLSIAQKKAVEESLEKKKLRFRDAMVDRRYGQLLEKDAKKARHICMDLDEKNGKPQSPLWPRTIPIATLHLPPGVNTTSELYKSTLDDTESDQEDFDSLCMQDKMEILTAYLRSQYYYCQWCCIEYENMDDLERNCPGDDRRDHDDD